MVHHNHKATKLVPPRLGPPPQLTKAIPTIEQQKFQPRMREMIRQQIRLIKSWLSFNLTWKKVLMSWMVVLIASKMVLLMLTYEFFSLTALISLQIFHGVWTIAFFCLNIIDSRAILPNASCLLAGYLPATTVLHILLIPNDYPLEFIIIDAAGTFLAIISMFLLLRMECTEILIEAEELWQRQAAESESGDTISTTSTTSLHRSDQNQRHHKSTTPAPSSPYIIDNRVVIGGGTGPTVITLDSMNYSSMDVPEGANVFFDEAIDLEPIDFEHFVDEPDLNRSRNENMFRVSTSPPNLGRGR